MMRIQVLLAVPLILLLSVAVGSGQSSGVPAKGDAHINPEVPRITATEAKKLFDQGKLILANAHEGGAEFEKTRLAGAISMADGWVQSANPPLPENMVVAFYCM